MPKWTTRLERERADDFHPGEAIRAASYFLGRGSTAGQIAFGMVRGVGRNVLDAGAIADVAASQAGTDAAIRSRDGYNTFSGSIASTIPNDKGIIAITDSRIVVFGYKQGVFTTKILDVVTAIDRSHLVGWSYTPGKLATVVNMAFSDDSNVGIEIPRANKPSEFASTLGIPETP